MYNNTFRSHIQLTKTPSRSLYKVIKYLNQTFILQMWCLYTRNYTCTDPGKFLIFGFDRPPGSNINQSQGYEKGVGQSPPPPPPPSSISTFSNNELFKRFPFFWKAVIVSWGYVCNVFVFYIFDLVFAIVDFLKQCLTRAHIEQKGRLEKKPGMKRFGTISTET